jgi:hypothetical protein
MFEMNPAEACGHPAGAATGVARVETSPNVTPPVWTIAATPTFTGADNHTMKRVTPTAGQTNVRFVRLTLLAPQNVASPVVDFTEFAVYSTTAIPGGTVTGPVVPTPTAIPTASPTPEPTVVAPPGPVDPTPGPTVVPRPSLTLPSSGRRSARFSVDCRAACRVIARLEVNASTARRLGLGRSRVAGTLTRNASTGRTTLTLKLNSKATRAMRKLRSFRATLRVSVAYSGAAPVAQSRSVTVRR